jgi:predicted small lipoprotein YifL
MHARLFAIVVTALAAGLAAGCGNKGPLAVPGVPAGTAWPYPSPKPSSSAPERKPADVPGSTDAKQ